MFREFLVDCSRRSDRAAHASAYSRQLLSMRSVAP
jgi:hypothetical protein